MRYQKGSFIVVPNSEELKGLHVAAQALYLWLCYHANQEGECFPSRKRLAMLCSISVDQVDIQMKTLVDRGLVLKEKRKSGAKNETNLYSVVVGGVADTVGEGSRYRRLGVADTVGSELNQSLTQSTEELIAEKTEKFIEDVKMALKDTPLNKEGVSRIREFVAYWTEPNKSKTKLRWELQPTWDIKRRVATWFRRSSGYSRTNTKPRGLNLNE